MNLNRYSTIKFSSIPKRTKIVPGLFTDEPSREQSDDQILKNTRTQMNSYAIEMTPASEQASIENHHRNSRVIMSQHLTPLFMSMENDKYSVNYYFTQAIAGTIINFTHLFFGPLSLIPLRFIYGKNLLHAMVFDLNLLYILGDFTSWLWVWFTVMFAYFNQNDNNQMAIIYFSTGGIIIMRQLLVSIKYGFYTKKQWELMKTTRVTEEFILNSLILIIWVKVPENIAETEMGISLSKNFINPEKVEMLFDYLPARCLGVKDSKDEEYEDYNSDEKKIGLIKVANYLIKQVSNTQTTDEIQHVNVFAIFYVLSFL